jgi:glucose/arabinose dehydrogenase
VLRRRDDSTVPADNPFVGSIQRWRDVRQGPDGLIYLLTEEDDGAVIRLEPLP